MLYILSLLLVGIGRNMRIIYFFFHFKMGGNIRIEIS